MFYFIFSNFKDFLKLKLTSGFKKKKPYKQQNLLRRALDEKNPSSRPTAMEFLRKFTQMLFQKQERSVSRPELHKIDEPSTSGLLFPKENQQSASGVKVIKKDVKRGPSVVFKKEKVGRETVVRENCFLGKVSSVCVLLKIYLKILSF